MALIQKIIKNRRQKGYTVIEVMIVLSISTLLFAGVVAGYNRQNSKTQFTNGVRDMENKIQDILNDVSTGFYPQSTNFSCIRSGSPPVPFINPGGSSEQGTNQQCIFLGKAVDINDGSMDAYTIVGLRNSSADETKLPININEARPRTIRSSIEGTYSNIVLNASIHIQRIITSSLPHQNSAGFAVVSGFGNGDKGGAGATTSQVAIARINPSYNFTTGTSQVVNTGDMNRGITICIREQPNAGRKASIRVGTNAQTNIETKIDDWELECN